MINFPYSPIGISNPTGIKINIKHKNKTGDETHKTTRRKTSFAFEHRRHQSSAMLMIAIPLPLCENRDTTRVVVHRYSTCVYVPRTALNGSMSNFVMLQMSDYARMSRVRVSFRIRDGAVLRRNFPYFFCENYVVFMAIVKR